MPDQYRENEFRDFVLAVAWHGDGPPDGEWDIPLSIVDSPLPVDPNGERCCDRLNCRAHRLPNRERLTRGNDVGDIYVDRMVIESIRTPEPTAMCLFAIGGLALSRHRR